MNQIVVLPTVNKRASTSKLFAILIPTDPEKTVPGIFAIKSKQINECIDVKTEILTVQPIIQVVLKS